MGAGGAIYLQAGELMLVNSTFEGNSALGGNGGDQVTSFPEPRGGGGGLSGNGGIAVSSGSMAEGGGANGNFGESCPFGPTARARSRKVVTA